MPRLCDAAYTLTIGACALKPALGCLMVIDIVPLPCLAFILLVTGIPLISTLFPRILSKWDYLSRPVRYGPATEVVDAAPIAHSIPRFNVESRTCALSGLFYACLSLHFH